MLCNLGMRQKVYKQKKDKRDKLCHCSDARRALAGSIQAKLAAHALYLQ